MSSGQMKSLSKKIQQAKNFLCLAEEQINLINKDCRSEQTDKLLNETLDSIFEAKGFLDNVEEQSFQYTGEDVMVVMRHRKKKQP